MTVILINDSKVYVSETILWYPHFQTLANISKLLECFIGDVTNYVERRQGEGQQLRNKLLGNRCTAVT